MEKKMDRANQGRFKLIEMAANLRKKGKTVEEINEVLDEKYTTVQIDNAIRAIDNADEIRKAMQ